MINDVTAGLLRHYADRIEKNEIGVKFDIEHWFEPSNPLAELIGARYKVWLNEPTIENLKIETLEDDHRCGTAACIAGHIALLESGVPLNTFHNFFDHGRRALQINKAEATVLFIPWSAGMFYDRDNADSGVPHSDDWMIDRASSGDSGSWRPSREDFVERTAATKMITREVAVAAMRKAADTRTFIGIWPEKFGVDYSAIEYRDANPDYFVDEYE